MRGLSHFSFIVDFAFGGLSWLISGVFCALYYHLIQSTATGGHESPDFPDISDLLGDIIMPLLQILLVGLVSFGPLFAYTFWADSTHPIITLALVGFA